MSAPGLFDTIFHKHAALRKVDRCVLFFCIGFALCRDLCVSDPFDLRVPDLVDPIDPLAPDIGGAFWILLGSDRHDGGDNKQDCKGSAHGGIPLIDDQDSPGAVPWDSARGWDNGMAGTLGTNGTAIPQPRASYSTVAFASLITAAHFATSPGSMADISAGVFNATGRPWRARLARTDSLAIADATALYN